MRIFARFILHANREETDQPGFGAGFYYGYSVSGILMIDNEAVMIKQELGWLLEKRKKFVK